MLKRYSFIVLYFPYYCVIVDYVLHFSPFAFLFFVLFFFVYYIIYMLLNNRHQVWWACPFWMPASCE